MAVYCRTKKWVLLILSVLVCCIILFVKYYTEYVNLKLMLLPVMRPSDCGFSLWRKNISITDKCGMKGKSSARGLDVALPIELPVPRVAHQILWTDTMTFRNYLSLLSVWKQLKPFVIKLYVRRHFHPKRFVYNDWFQKATDRISNLQVIQLDLLDVLNYSPVDESIGALSVLKENGGIYVNMNTLVSSDLWLFLGKRTFYAGFTADLSISFIAMSQREYKPEKIWTFKKESVCHCVTMETYTGSEICCTVSKEIIPVTIMPDSSPFGSLARTLFYGSPNLPVPNTSFPPIPKLVHYVWFGGGDIDYSMSFSVHSTQRFVKPLHIFIYVDQIVPRKNLDKLTTTYDNVHIVYTGSLKSVYQTPLRAISHASDFLRSDLLYRHGGIYIDWDVYWLKPIDDIISMGYEAIASLDYYVDQYPRKTYPDTINMGVLLARPNSKFLGLWRESYKQYKDTEGYHTYQAVEYVYKLYEEHPDALAIDKRLQIMCHELRCHPLWLSDYKDFYAHHEFDFTKDVYAVHFTWPTPKAFTSDEHLKTDTGFFADMARHVAGIP